MSAAAPGFVEPFNGPGLQIVLDEAGTLAAAAGVPAVSDATETAVRIAAGVPHPAHQNEVDGPPTRKEWGQRPIHPKRRGPPKAAKAANRDERPLTQPGSLPAPLRAG
jgi:hypothetical protein